MTPSIDFLQGQFHTFNKAYFDGDLPMPRFVITHARTVLGQFVCTKRSAWLFFGGEPRDCTIKISSFYDMPEREYQNTLLHEMIHYYISYKRIKDTSPHGRVFRQIMRQLNDEGWNVSVRGKTTGYVIAHRTDKNRFRTILAIKTTDGRFFVSVVQPSAIVKIEAMIKREPIIEIHTWLRSSEENFSRFPTVRTLRGKRVTEEEYNRIVTMDEKIIPLMS